MIRASSDLTKGFLNWAPLLRWKA